MLLYEWLKLPPCLPTLQYITEGHVVVFMKGPSSCGTWVATTPNVCSQHRLRPLLRYVWHTSKSPERKEEVQPMSVSLLLPATALPLRGTHTHFSTHSFWSCQLHNRCSLLFTHETERDLLWTTPADWSPEVSGTGEFVGRLCSLSGGLAGSCIFILSSLQTLFGVK